MRTFGTIILIAVFFLPAFSGTAAAQDVACLQQAFPDATVIPYTTVYTRTSAFDNTKIWYWTSPAEYLLRSNGAKGVWRCVEGKVTLTPTGAIPACVNQLQTLTPTSNPDMFAADIAGMGKITIWISNSRYMLQTTKATGSWQCAASGKIEFGQPQQPSVPANNSAGQQGSVPANNPVTGGLSAVTATDSPLTIKLKNPLKVDTIQDAIKLFMDAIIKIAIPFIVVFFIWAGLKFILAQGKEEELRKAKKMFWYTIIGTLLILGAWAITDAIVGTINSFAS